MEWQPKLEPPKSQPASNHFDLAPYLRATRLGKWTYLRCEPNRTAEAEPYARRINAARSVEGALLGRSFLPLDCYLLRPTSAASQPADSPPVATQPVDPDDPNRPRAPLKGGTAFLFELATPLAMLPEGLAPGEPIRSVTPLIYYEYDGRFLADGTLERVVEIESTEAVEVPAGRFDGCLRVRVDLVVRLPWRLAMYWTSYSWFSPTAGEVRRLEHMTGWFLIFPFESTCRCDLADYRPILSGDELAGLPSPAWRYGAVVLDRVFPAPRIAGMVIDFAQTQPAP